MTTCPRCGAAESTRPLATRWECGTEFDEHDCLASLECKLRQIAALARQHATPASNVGAHALAVKIIKIVEGTDG